MAFEDDALSFGWASTRDCTDQLSALAAYVQGDPGPVQRAIAAATGRAQTYLRVRWPDAWPFSTPPTEVREAVAALAVYSAVRGFGMEAAALTLVEQLRLEAKRAEAWLRDVASGKADLVMPRPASGAYHNEYATAKLPGGEFGFGE